MAAVPCPVLVLPPAVSGQQCLSFLQLWAALSSTSHSSSARELAGTGTGTGVMPMDTGTHLCRGAAPNTSQLSSPGESTQLSLHSPKLGKAILFNISASVS